MVRRRICRKLLAAYVIALVMLGAAMALVHPARTEAAELRHIGVLLVGRSAGSKDAQHLRQALLEAGYAEGRDIAIEWRSANGDFGQIDRLVADLVQRKVDVIVVDSTLATQVLKRTTSSIPIVMALVADPVGSGLVTNFAHPGGNITGLSMMIPEMNLKRLQLLKEAMPQIRRVAVLWNPATPWHAKAIEDLKAAAPSLSLDIRFVAARTPAEIRSAFATASRARAEALQVIDDGLFVANRNALLELAMKWKLPGIYWERTVAEAGGLMSYGANYDDLFRRSAGYVDRILKGAQPGDLPIEQPTKFELVVNRTAARALGIAVPESILLRADATIQ